MKGKDDPFCWFKGNTVLSLLSHYRTVHREDKNFLESCFFPGCIHTFKFTTESGLRKHFERAHMEVFLYNSEQAVVVQESEDVADRPQVENLIQGGMQEQESELLSSTALQPIHLQEPSVNMYDTNLNNMI